MNSISFHTIRLITNNIFIVVYLTKQQPIFSNQNIWLLCKGIKKKKSHQQEEMGKTYDVSWVEKSPFQFAPLRKSPEMRQLLEIWNDDSGPVGTGTQRPFSGLRKQSVITWTHSRPNSYVLLIEIVFRHESIDGRGNLCDCWWNEHSLVGHSGFRLWVSCLPQRLNVILHIWVKTFPLLLATHNAFQMYFQG